jgi:glycosyltransferase involved in cell wall biosynthesis
VKILQILPKIPYPPIDGHKKSMWGVIKYLSDRGHNIDIIAYGQKDDQRKYEGEISKYANLFVVDIKAKNSFAGAIRNLFSAVPYNLSKYQTKGLEKFVTEHLAVNKYDIIHVTNAHMGWVVNTIRKLCDTPVVLREENFELIIMERYFKNCKNPVIKYYAFLQYKKFLKYEPSLCGKFDIAIMMSKEDEHRLLELNPDVKTKVIPLGIEKELLEIKRSSTEKYSLAYIGSLEWYPNYDGLKWFLKDIFPIVTKKFKEAKLYLYGGGIPKNFYFPESVKDNIIVKGFVSDIWNEVNNGSLAVVPLRIGSGIRVKILEMLASGINVITTQLGKEGIPAKDGEELLVANTKEEFAGKIIDFFNNKFDAEMISLKGKELVKQNYIWENIAEKFEQTYYELL